ncbi:molybdopterin molybdotransferase MoeA [uncultured Sphingomonas sp.]|uniref:molybdopterin molybdotransferase MoeA n=1 Tax=uncultured Sphingomonas sp. TaxID=158754 RepID=UPI0035CC4651
MSLLSILEAQARLFALAAPLPVENVPLAQAIGRWAAGDVHARRTQPAATLSAMDGYAIRFADLPGPWTMVGESAAGRPFAGPIGPGECARIFTGAAMPDGADTVLVQEEAARDGDHVLLAGEGPLALARNTRRRGLDFTEGDRLIARGERLTAARLALAATGGHGALAVARRVRVALAATGDELVPPGSAIDALSLPESNTTMLRALLTDLPVDIVDIGILPDRLDALRDAFAGADVDVLVTTGGASVGDHDLVRPALEAAGGSLDFWRVALRPGKPMIAGRLGDGTVVGLPGNPVSVFVTTLLFLKPLIAHLSHAADPLPRTTRATLGEPLAANGGRQDYVRAELRDGLVFSTGLQDSSMLQALARADCLVVRPAGAAPAMAGDSAEVLMIA